MHTLTHDPIGHFAHGAASVIHDLGHGVDHVAHEISHGIHHIGHQISRMYYFYLQVCNLDLKENCNTNQLFKMTDGHMVIV